MLSEDATAGFVKLEILRRVTVAPTVIAGSFMWWISESQLVKYLFTTKEKQKQDKIITLKFGSRGDLLSSNLAPDVALSCSYKPPDRK